MADGQVLRPMLFMDPKGQVGRRREGLHTEGSAKGSGRASWLTREVWSELGKPEGRQRRGGWARGRQPCGPW